MRSIILSGFLLLSCATLSAGSARAESMAIRGCYSMPSVLPVAGTEIPADLPAFVFKPAGYSYPATTRTIDQYALELRTNGDVLIPVALEAQADGSYLVRPQQPLPLGSVGLSFLDNCTSYMGGGILDAPVRNERFTYTVVAAASIPTTAGTATVNSVNYTTQPYNCDRPNYASATLDLVMAPGLASFPLINVRVWLRGNAYDQQQYGRLDAENIIRVSLAGDCYPLGSDPLISGVNEVTVEVQVVGMPDWLQASPVDVTIDCSPRPPGAGPPFCSPDSGTPDGGSDTTPDALPDDLNAGAETPLIRDSGVAWVVVEGPPPEQTGDAGGAKVASMDAQTVASMDAQTVASMDAQTVASMDVQTVATIDAQAEVRPRSNGCGCTVGGRHGPLPRAETLTLGLILAAVGALRRRRR
jgi:MYXO-CTERM domain-containing protein